MKVKNPVITDNGIVIDPDDDVEVIKHNNVLEIAYDKHIIYCEKIYPYHYD